MQVSSTPYFNSIHVTHLIEFEILIQFKELPASYTEYTRNVMFATMSQKVTTHYF